MYGLDFTKIRKGDTVFVASDDPRDFRSQREEKVLSVGPKYITLDTRWKEKYYVETGSNKEWSTWRIYPSREVYENIKRRKQLSISIERNISKVIFNATDDEVEIIKGIVEKYTQL